MFACGVRLMLKGNCIENNNQIIVAKDCICNLKPVSKVLNCKNLSNLSGTPPFCRHNFCGLVSLDPACAMCCVSLLFCVVPMKDAYILYCIWLLTTVNEMI